MRATGNERQEMTIDQRRELLLKSAERCEKACEFWTMFSGGTESNKDESYAIYLDAMKQFSRQWENVLALLREGGL